MLRKLLAASVFLAVLAVPARAATLQGVADSSMVDLMFVPAVAVVILQGFLARHRPGTH